MGDTGDMAPQGQYLIAQGASEWERLEWQHKLWIQNIGYLVHPAAEKTLGETPCIADIATGTGIHLLDLARKYPNSPRLDGFDILSAQFPSDVPPNVNFLVHDAKTPFPAELHGQYDLVHLRLLFSAMEKEDWSTVLANVVELLKPGGVIQWAESALASAMILRGPSVMVPETMYKVNEYFQMGLRHRLKSDYFDLPAIYARHGLQSVVQDVLASDNNATTRAGMSSTSMGGCLAFMTYAYIQGVDGGWDLERIETLRRGVEEEIAAGAYLRWEIYITVGFKAAT